VGFPGVSGWKPSLEHVPMKKYILSSSIAILMLLMLGVAIGLSAPEQAWAQSPDSIEGQWMDDARININGDLYAYGSGFDNLRLARHDRDIGGSGENQNSSSEGYSGHPGGPSGDDSGGDGSGGSGNNEQSGQSGDGDGGGDGNSEECGENEVEVSVEVGGNRCVQNSEDSLENNAIVVYLRYLIQFLTAGVGLVITIMIVVGGVQYITAGENSQKVQAAKQKIFNAVLALILFILMYALLSYLVPVDIF
jgi:hypothetical protein